MCFPVRSPLEWVWVFELISMVKMESRYSVDGPFSREFSSIYIVGGYRRLKSLTVFAQNLRFFLEKKPSGKIFKKTVTKGFIVTQIHVLCANFVKFGRPEVCKLVRCLPHKKTEQNFGSLSRSRFCADRAQNSCQGWTESNPVRESQISVPAEL